MDSRKFVRDINEIEPTALIEFFTIQYDAYNPDAIFYFHGGCNEDGGILQNIVWQGHTYYAIPLETEAFEVVANQKTPRPHIKFANPDFYISQILRRFNRLLNAKVTRKRVYLKYLDAINFAGGVNPYGVPDTSGGFPDEVFFINRVVSENKALVEFELSSSLELENVKVPARQIIARYCSFCYRGAGCLYDGAPKKTGRDEDFKDSAGTVIAPASLVMRGEWSADTAYNKGDYVFKNSKVVRNRGEDPTDITYVKVFFVCREAHTSTVNDNPFKRSDLWDKDDCSRRIQGCKSRFSSNLPFGGYIGTYGYGA